LLRTLEQIKLLIEYKAIKKHTDIKDSNKTEELDKVFGLNMSILAV
jgi:hypothetical protein